MHVEHARCPYCHDQVRPDHKGKRACTDCMAWQHEACWDELGRCGACQLKAPESPPPSKEPLAERDPRRGARLASWLTAAAALGSLPIPLIADQLAGRYEEELAVGLFVAWLTLICGLAAHAKRSALFAPLSVLCGVLPWVLIGAGLGSPGTFYVAMGGVAASSALLAMGLAALANRLRAEPSPEAADGDVASEDVDVASEDVDERRPPEKLKA